MSSVAKVDSRNACATLPDLTEHDAETTAAFTDLLAAVRDADASTQASSDASTEGPEAPAGAESIDPAEPSEPAVSTDQRESPEEDTDGLNDTKGTEVSTTSAIPGLDTGAVLLLLSQQSPAASGTVAGPQDTAPTQRPATEASLAPLGTNPTSAAAGPAADPASTPVEGVPDLSADTDAAAPSAAAVAPEKAGTAPTQQPVTDPAQASTHVQSQEATSSQLNSDSNPETSPGPSLETAVSDAGDDSIGQPLQVAPQAAPATPTVPVLSPVTTTPVASATQHNEAVVSQVSEAIERIDLTQATTGPQKAVIRLNPDAMGSISVVIRHTERGLDVTFRGGADAIAALSTGHRDLLKTLEGVSGGAGANLNFTADQGQPDQQGRARNETSTGGQQPEGRPRGGGTEGFESPTRRFATEAARHLTPAHQFSDSSTTNRLDIRA